MLALGYLVGPLLVGLIFSDQYVLGGLDVALLAVGVAAYIGLILVTQVLVASARHRLVAWSWLTGVVVATVVLLLVPDLLLGAELAFLTGSVTGGRRNPAGPHHRTRAESCSVPDTSRRPSPLPSRTTPRTSRA